MGGRGGVPVSGGIGFDFFFFFFFVAYGFFVENSFVYMLGEMNGVLDR